MSEAIVSKEMHRNNLVQAKIYKFAAVLQMYPYLIPSAILFEKEEIFNFGKSITIYSEMTSYFRRFAID